jgi:hypothetical protein
MKRYRHDCPTCKTLGQHGHADLYFCEQGGAGPTVIARYSHDVSDYICGLWLAEKDPDLVEAKRRAIALGFLAAPTIKPVLHDAVVQALDALKKLHEILNRS